MDVRACHDNSSCGDRFGGVLGVAPQIPVVWRSKIRLFSIDAAAARSSAADAPCAGQAHVFFTKWREAREDCYLVILLAVSKEALVCVQRAITFRVAHGSPHSCQLGAVQHLRGGVHASSFHGHMWKEPDNLQSKNLLATRQSHNVSLCLGCFLGGHQGQ